MSPTLGTTGDLLNSPTALIGAFPDLAVDVQDQGTGFDSATVSVDGNDLETRYIEDFAPESQSCQGGSCQFQAQLPIDLSGQSPGTHVVALEVKDLAGNIAQTTNTVTLDPTEPALNLSGDLIDADGQPLPEETASVAIDAGDLADGDSGLKRLTVAVDDQPVTDYPVDCGSGCPSSLQESYEYVKADWGPGPHDVTIEATDAAGNSNVLTIKADKPPPTPQVTCPTETPT